MTNRQIYTTICLTLTGALLLLPRGLMAQEEDDAPPPEPKVVAQPKLAIELGAPFADNASLQREMPCLITQLNAATDAFALERAG